MHLKFVIEPSSTLIANVIMNGVLPRGLGAARSESRTDEERRNRNINIRISDLESALVSPSRHAVTNQSNKHTPAFSASQNIITNHLFNIFIYLNTHQHHQNAPPQFHHPRYLGPLRRRHPRRPYRSSWLRQRPRGEMLRQPPRISGRRL